jgi:UDP-GlcNAc:undecaprenyl-phosphate/decaprenyl-phosphate GlcNAc-1-phosphate transferase
MPGIFPAFALPFLTTLLFLLALRPLAVAAELVDRPGGRKRHDGHVPLIGGLAMFCGFVIAGPSIEGTLVVPPSLMVASALLVAVGILDDKFDLPPGVRFLAQVLAALIMTVGAGVVAGNLGPVFFDGPVELGQLSVLFTILVVGSSINAFNMFDGSDGAAGGQALACLTCFATAELIGGQSDNLPQIAILAGSIVAFLILNLPFTATRRMRVFMGDAGSTFLGFVLAWLAVSMSQGRNAVIAPVTMLWIGALPLLDFFCSMVRRVMQGRSPFHADSEHLHHVLRRAGLNSMQIFLAETSAGLLLGTIGVAGYVFGVHDGVMFFALLAIAVAYYLIFASGRVFERESSEAEEGFETETA